MVRFSGTRVLPVPLVMADISPRDLDRGKFWAAYAQLNQTILGAMSQLTSLVANHGGAFIPKEQRGESGDPQANGRPIVNITVALTPPRVAPPVDPAEAPSADPATKP